MHANEIHKPTVRCYLNAQAAADSAHLYFGLGPWVEQRPDEHPDALEQHRRVDDHDAAQHLRVVVLVKGGDLFDQIPHLRTRGGAPKFWF